MYRKGSPKEVLAANIAFVGFLRDRMARRDDDTRAHQSVIVLAASGDSNALALAHALDCDPTQDVKEIVPIETITGIAVGSNPSVSRLLHRARSQVSVLVFASGEVDLFPA